MSELTLAFVQAALNAPVGAQADAATRIITDSRQAEAGDVFVALVGEQFDGHDYVADVLAKGVAAVIVSREIVAGDARQIVVADTLAALGQIAQAWRLKWNPKIVALTGSNGKTTVKQTDLCWGKKALDKIVKWEGPMKFGDYQEAGITYTYKVNNLADWAKKPDVQAAFPFVKSILDGAGSKESKHAIKLTSQGWEAKGLD